MWAIRPRAWAWGVARAGDTLLLALGAGADAGADVVISDLQRLRLLDCGERALRTPRACAALCSVAWAAFSRCVALRCAADYKPSQGVPRGYDGTL